MADPFALRSAARTVASRYVAYDASSPDDLPKGFGTDVSAITAGLPLGRKGVPTDISELVGFLVSERAAWITGATSHVDGRDSPFVG